MYFYSVYCLITFLRAFDFLELKMYDLKFGIRGALSADGSNSWPLAEKFTDLNDNKKWDLGRGIC